MAQMKHKKNYFIRIMLRFSYFVVLTISLNLALNLIFVHANTVISNQIDIMISGVEISIKPIILKFIVLTILGVIISFCANFLGLKYAIKVITKYRKLIGDKIYHMEYRYFDENNSATMINKVNADIAEAESFLRDSLIAIISSLTAVLIYANYIRQLNLSLFFVVMLCYPFVFWLAQIIVKRISNLSKIYRAKTDIMISIDQDVIGGEKIVKAFALQDYFSDKMHRVVLDLVDNEEKRTSVSNTALVARKTIQWLPSIVCGFLSVFLVKNGSLSIGELVSFVVILGKFVSSFIGLPFAFVDSASSFVSIKRLEEMLSFDSELFGTETSIADKEKVISIEKAVFGYDQERSILKELSLYVNKGENVAIVGKSGGGKSTIFRIICGFYHLSNGCYKFYGRDINDWKIENVRNELALVSQDIFLFPGTIEENILYGNENATHEQVIQACMQAEIHDFIMGMSDQYQTIVGERGSLLSGGQKQRISIARAILKNASVLLLDEPTSSVDEETEYLIQKALKSLCEGKTSITIAHRLSTIREADRIMVLQSGEMIEVGTHDELMNIDGVYAAMYGRG